MNANGSPVTSTTMSSNDSSRPGCRCRRPRTTVDGPGSRRPDHGRGRRSERVDPPDPLDDLRAQPATIRRGQPARRHRRRLRRRGHHARVQTALRHPRVRSTASSSSRHAATCCCACARRCPTSPATPRPRPSRVDRPRRRWPSHAPRSPTTASAIDRHPGRPSSGLDNMRVRAGALGGVFSIEPPCRRRHAHDLGRPPADAVGAPSRTRLGRMALLNVVFAATIVRVGECTILRRRNCRGADATPGRRRRRRVERPPGRRSRGRPSRRRPGEPRCASCRSRPTDSKRTATEHDPAQRHLSTKRRGTDLVVVGASTSGATTGWLRTLRCSTGRPEAAHVPSSSCAATPRQPLRRIVVGIDSPSEPKLPSTGPLTRPRRHTPNWSSSTPGSQRGGPVDSIRRDNDLARDGRPMCRRSRRPPMQTNAPACAARGELIEGERRDGAGRGQQERRPHRRRLTG